MVWASTSRSLSIGPFKANLLIFQELYLHTVSWLYPAHGLVRPRASHQERHGRRQYWSRSRLRWCGSRCWSGGWPCSDMDLRPLCVTYSGYGDKRGGIKRYPEEECTPEGRGLRYGAVSAEPALHSAASDVCTRDGREQLRKDGVDVTPFFAWPPASASKARLAQPAAARALMRDSQRSIRARLTPRSPWPIWLRE